ncbi:MAG: helix-turn-helix transcriptional regulator [Chloroflexi bacterium]|nr:helix-turn-helix transcriptional regulator [Chloroflexota bacterium]
MSDVIFQKEEGALWPTRIERFVEPCILLLLSEEPRHGYSLREELAKREFTPGEPDFGYLYRTLRRMEAEGLVSSKWAEEGPGPLKRIYSLTPRGQEFLKVWAEGLLKTKEALQNFFTAYQRQNPK